MTDEEEVPTTPVVLFHQNKTILDLILFSLQSNFNFRVKDFTDLSTQDMDTEKIKETKLFLIDSSYGEEVIKGFIDTNKIQVPIIICSCDDPKSFKSLPESNTLKFTGQKDTLKEIENHVNQFFEIDPNAKKQNHCPIAMKTLIRFNGVNDDIFIKLRSGRYLKIFSKNDFITVDDVTRYAKKGVHHLYLNRLTSRWILKEINKDFGAAVAQIESNQGIELSEKSRKDFVENEATPEEKAASIEDVLSFDKEFQENMQKTMTKTIKSIKKNPKLSSMFKKLKVLRDEGAYFNTHIGLLCNISCAIAKVLEWGREATFEKLVFCSYMHDITLLNYPELAKIQTLDEFAEEKAKLTPEQSKAYLNHPQDCVDLLNTLLDVPQEADTIILQHHELPNQMGFPNKIQTQRISPLSALFIVSHRLVNYIIEDPKWNIREFLEKNEGLFVGPNFRRVQGALKNLK